MPNEKFRYRLMRWFTSHPWFKLIALLLAIIVWFYVRGELDIIRFNY